MRKMPRLRCVDMISFEAFYIEMVRSLSVSRYDGDTIATELPKAARQSDVFQCFAIIYLVPLRWKENFLLKTFPLFPLFSID